MNKTSDKTMGKKDYCTTQTERQSLERLILVLTFNHEHVYECLCVCVCACKYVHVSSDASGGQKYQIP